MTAGPRRAMRLYAGMLAGAMALSLVPVVGASVAGAADPLPPVADPIAAGAFCDGAPGTNPFTDLGAESASTREVILCLVATELTAGTSETTYTPGGTVTRRQMALFIKRLADLFDELETDDFDLAALPAYDNLPDYPDVVLEDAEFQEAIGQLTQADIVGGFPDGTFRPNAQVSRRQMAAFVNRLQEFLAGSPYTSGDADYFDDDDGDSGEANLNALAAVGIFHGDGAGNVFPGNDLTRRQMANILLRNAQVHFAFGSISSPFAASNQTFTVAPRDAEERPQGDTRDHVAAVGDVDDVTLILVECENVSMTGGLVSFEAQDGDADAAERGDTADAEFSEINDVVQVGGTDQATVTPEAGEISFTVTADDRVCVVPVLYEGAADELAIDGDGEPTVAFGIGGRTLFADVAGSLVMDPDTDVNPTGTNHTVTATLVTGATADDIVVPLDGQTVEFTVAEVPGVDDLAGCETVDIVALPASQVLDSVDRTTVDGVATFTYTGPDEDADQCIFATWSGDAPYDGATASGTAHVQWLDADPAATVIGVEPAQDSNLVATTHTVTATVTDQFGDPLAGQTVRFEIDRETGTDPAPVTRTTNSSGVATLAYNGPSTGDVDMIEACTGAGIVASACDDSAAPGLVDDAIAYWVEQAVNSSDSDTSATVVGVDLAANTFDTDGPNGFNRYTYKATDQYFVGCAAAPPASSIGAFEAALSVGDTATVGYDSTSPSIITLIDNDCD